MQAWVESAKKRSQFIDKFKQDLFWFGYWVGSGRSGVILYLIGIIIYMGIGFVWGINSPSSIACKKIQSACYLMRWDKNQVVLPQQAQQLIQEYERSKKKPHRSFKKKS